MQFTTMAKMLLGLPKKLDPALTEAFSVFFKQSWQEYCAQASDTITNAFSKLQEYETKIPELKTKVDAYNRATAIYNNGKDVVEVAKKLDPALTEAFSVFFKQSWQEYCAQASDTIKNSLIKLQEYETKIPELKKNNAQAAEDKQHGYDL